MGMRSESGVVGVRLCEHLVRLVRSWHRAWQIVVLVYQKWKRLSH